MTSPAALSSSSFSSLSRFLPTAGHPVVLVLLLLGLALTLPASADAQRAPAPQSQPNPEPAASAPELAPAPSDSLQATTTRPRPGRVLDHELPSPQPLGEILDLENQGPAARALETEGLRLAEKIVERSGVGLRLDQSAAMLTLQMQENGLSLPGDFLQAFTYTLTDPFHGEELRQRVAQQLASELDLETLRAIDAFYDSPLGLRVAFLERRAETPEGLEGLSAYIDQILETPPDAHRVDLLQSIDRASFAVDIRLDTSVQLLNAMLGGLQPFLAEDQQLSDIDLTVELVAYRMELQSTLRSQLYILQLYAYADLSDQQLAEYLDFWQSLHGLQLAHTLASAIPTALERAAGEAGDQLAQMARQPNGDQLAQGGTRP
ncbi:MAG: hypothetical protein AAGD01_15155 [Acidobacteriota bacterium]